MTKKLLDKVDTAIHEAGHAVAALWMDEYLILKYARIIPSLKPIRGVLVSQFQTGETVINERDYFVGLTELAWARVYVAGCLAKKVMIQGLTRTEYESGGSADVVALNRVLPGYDDQAKVKLEVEEYLGAHKHQVNAISEQLLDKVILSEIEIRALV